MKAFIFPGQGAQYTGMGKLLYDNNAACRDLFEHANEILGFRLSDVMFSGTPDELRRTKVTQPAIFLHSIAETIYLGDAFAPSMVAGHSLGEFSALVAARAMSFDDGLRLVAARAQAMQKCCELTPSTMAAVLKLDDATVEQICKEIDEVVVPANYNSPGQIVISGTTEGIKKAINKIKEAKGRALPLDVGGAFHSPLMEAARNELQQAIDATPLHAPICPVYQNVCATAVSDVQELRNNLVKQLTSPVRWTQTIQNMVANGATNFIEAGPGKVLQGLIRRITPYHNATSAVDENGKLYIERQDIL